MNKNLDIYTMSLPEAWNMFKVMHYNDGTYKQVRSGINVLFDINDYLKGRIITKPKVGIALIRGKTCKLEDFETELENRETVLKKWLLENYGEEELVKSRGDY